MTDDQKSELKKIYAECTSRDDFDTPFAGAEGALLLRVAIAFYNAGAEAMEAAIKMEVLDFYEGERLSEHTAAAKAATIIKP